MNEIGRRVMTHILKGNVPMIRGLLELGFLDPQYDMYTFTGGFSNNPEDQYLAIELIASRHSPIPNYKEMIDLFLSQGVVHVDDHAGAITPLEMAIAHKNYAVAAYLQLKGGTYNVEEITKFGEDIGTNLIEELKVEFDKLQT